MDILEHIPEFRVVVCKLCKTAVYPSALSTHLRRSHPRYFSSSVSSHQFQTYTRSTLPSLLEHSLLDPRSEPVIRPAIDQTPIPQLSISSGYGCSYCPLVSVSVQNVQKHYNVAHAPKRRGRGGLQSSGSRAVRELLQQKHFGGGPPWVAIKFQRFFRSGPGSTGFRVREDHVEPSGHESPEKATDAQKSTRRTSVTDEIFKTLAALRTEQGTAAPSLCRLPIISQVSPWLERTRWPSYLSGTSLREAARLARLPDREESALKQITLSIDRLIDAAYTSVCEDKVNFFAQKCISSFLPNKKAYSQPLMVKLQKPTYQRYKDTWKRLICFAYRSSDLFAAVRLRHRLNPRQTALLDELVAASISSLATNSDDQHESSRSVAMRPTRQLDDLCLDFCVSLLDHELKGDIYESVVLGLLAILGIDTTSSTFLEAPNYTSKLSGFIKISQMLVLEKAIREVEYGNVENVLDPLDDMRQRFMTVDNCTPFSWAVSLRSFGKRIRDSTTSLGYIQWSDDGRTIFYKDLELQIHKFQEFVTAQVSRVQSLLADLCLVAPDEAREDVVPPLYLHRIRDNPTVTEVGWSFLEDDRNKETMPCKKGWLLRRLLRNDRLREEFTYPGYVQKVVWDKQAMRRYRKKVETFLEGLLLLIHITSGQPARGTEIIGVQHSNSTFHRNIFIEDGLVALVTSYHKGYTCTGSTKIIHRYLPREVSELFVYYVWIICPFLQELNLLVPSPKHISSSFLWPDGDKCWSSQRLSDVLKRETAVYFKAPMTIPIYRHVAIAISRRFLEGGGFKRDYDVGDRLSDLQTAHNSSTAGRLYARGLEELPGHVEARRAGYRAVSRAWHALLGFASVVKCSKRPLLENIDEANLQKRRRL